MTPLLGVVAPVFGIMALGYGAVKAGGLPQAGVRGLVLFVFNAAIPSLLFRSLAGVALPEHIEWGFLAAFYAGSVTTYALGMGAGRLFSRALDEQAIFGMSAAFSNTVLLGIPVILTAFGPEATLPIFLIITFHSATFMPLTVALIETGRGQGVAWRTQVGSVFGALVRNPIIVGLGLGLASNLTGIRLPLPLDRVVEWLAGAAVPCALFAMGASLASYPLTGDVPPAVALTALKLVVHPLIVWVVAVPVLGLEGLWVPVAVLMAAMPSGVNAYLFGARYEAAPGVAARTVLLSSVLSVGTLSALLLVLAA